MWNDRPIFSALLWRDRAIYIGIRANNYLLVWHILLMRSSNRQVTDKHGTTCRLPTIKGATPQSTLSFFFFEDVVKDNGGVVLEVMTTFHKRYFVTWMKPKLAPHIAKHAWIQWGEIFKILSLFQPFFFAFMGFFLVFSGDPRLDENPLGKTASLEYHCVSIFNLNRRGQWVCPLRRSCHTHCRKKSTLVPDANPR